VNKSKGVPRQAHTFVDDRLSKPGGIMDARAIVRVFLGADGRHVAHAALALDAREERHKVLPVC